MFSSSIGHIFVNVEEAFDAFDKRLDEIESGSSSVAITKVIAEKVDLSRVVEPLRDACFTLKAHRMRARDIMMMELPKDFIQQLMDDVMPVVAQVITSISNKRAELCQRAIQLVARTVGGLTLAEISAKDPQGAVDSFVASILHSIRDFLGFHHSLKIEQLAEDDGIVFCNKLVTNTEQLVKNELMAIHNFIDRYADENSTKGKDQAAAHRATFVVASIARLIYKIVVPAVSGDPTQLKNVYTATSRQLVYRFIPMIGGFYASMINTALESGRWAQKKEPTDVSGFMTALFDEWRHLELLCVALIPPEHRRTQSTGSALSGNSGQTKKTGTASRSSGTAGVPAVANFQRREHKLSLATSDKMLSRNAGGLSFKPSTIDSHHVMECVLTYTIKAFVEAIRSKVFNKGGFQQLQVDCSYLIQVLRHAHDNSTATFFRKEERVLELIHEACCSGYDRCTERIALPSPSVESIARSAIEGASRTPAGTPPPE